MTSTTSTQYAIVRVAERRAELIAAADARRLARQAREASASAPAPTAAPARTRSFRFRTARVARRSTTATA